MSAVDETLAAQRRYALLLLWCTRGGLLCLVLAFVAYASGWIPAHVPIERVASLWGMPAAEYLRATGVEAGWGWARLIPRGDLLVVAAIAWLASCSIACLAAAAPTFFRGGERTLAVVCVLEIAVLVLAASGVF